MEQTNREKYEPIIENAGKISKLRDLLEAILATDKIKVYTGRLGIGIIDLNEFLSAEDINEIKQKIIDNGTANISEQIEVLMSKFKDL